MYQINDNVFLVVGAKNGAIYNLNDGKVYSIDESAILIIKEIVIEKRRDPNSIELEYLERLTENSLINKNYTAKKIELPKDESIKLNFAWIELTHSCNLRCVHCYEGDSHKELKEPFSLNEWKEILIDLKNNGCKSIQFTGGEPCLFSGLKELLIFARELKFETITLFSNANLMDDELIQLLKDLSVNVRVSIYGHNKDIHEAITRVPGSFDKTVSNVKKMVGLDISVTPSIIIMRQNQDFVEEIKDFVISLGLKYNGYDVIRTVHDGSQDQYAPTNQKVIDSKIRKKSHFIANKEKFYNSFSRNGCWYGKIAIDSEGNVFPCVFERKISYGNLKKESLDEILKGSSLKRCWLCDYSHIETCKDCEFRFACKDCRANSSVDGENFYAKRFRCMYDPYAGKWIEK